MSTKTVCEKDASSSRGKSVAVVGTFDVDNYGDCLFPLIYDREIKARLPGARLEYFSPYRRTAAFLPKKLNVRSIPATRSQIATLEFDSAVLAGGDTIGFGHSLGTYVGVPSNSISASSRLWIMPAILKAHRGTSFILGPCGMDNLTQPHTNLIGSVLKHSDLLAVRDEYSACRLKSVGVVPEVLPDTGVLVSELLSEPEWEGIFTRVQKKQVIPEEYLILQLSYPYFQSNQVPIAELIRQIYEVVKCPILLMPICRFLCDHEFLQHIKNGLSDLGSNLLLAQNSYDCLETAALIRKSRGLIGTSLHGAITAYSFGRPFGVCNQSGHTKHRGTLRVLDEKIMVGDGIEDLLSSFRINSSLQGQSSSKYAKRRCSEYFDRLGKIVSTSNGQNVMNLDNSLDLSEAIGEAEIEDLRTAQRTIKRQLLVIREGVPWLRYMSRLKKIKSISV